MTSATTTSTKPRTWMPDYGSLDARVTADPEGARVIHHTLTWNSQTEIDEFGEDVYEHDLKLYNDAIAGGTRPACFGTDDDFWANRDGFMAEWTFPEEANGYPDTEFLDDCSEMDLTVGVYHPVKLTAGVTYDIWITTTGHEDIEKSPLGLAAQRLPNNCPGKPDFQLCLNESQNGISEPIIARAAGCSVPGYFEWVAGDSFDCTPQRSGTTQLVSLNSLGEQHNGVTMWATDISATGRFQVFSSSADNLDVNDIDANAEPDIFVRDQETGTTDRVSVDSFAGEANDASLNASISADGRYVAFDSYASNLDSLRPDNNKSEDVFLHDRATSETVRISVNAGGEEGNHTSYGPSISADGRYIAFYSYASNLVAGDTNRCIDPGYGYSVPCPDAFRYDRETGQILRASVGPGGIQSNGLTYSCSISSDGRYIVFASLASNLVIGDTNGRFDTFVRDLAAGTTERVSIPTTSFVPEEGNANSGCGDISADGRYVAFSSAATNLTGLEDTNSALDVFVRDRLQGQTRFVSLSKAIFQGNGDSYYPQISNDAHFVGFLSEATNFAVNDGNYSPDVFVRDLTDVHLEIASVSSAGELAEYGAGTVYLSADGRYVAFDSYSTNLVLDDANHEADVFVRDRAG